MKTVRFIYDKSLDGRKRLIDDIAEKYSLKLSVSPTANDGEDIAQLNKIVIKTRAANDFYIFDLTKKCAADEELCIGHIQSAGAMLAEAGNKLIVIPSPKLSPEFVKNLTAAHDGVVAEGSDFERKLVHMLTGETAEPVNDERGQSEGEPENPMVNMSEPEETGEQSAQYDSGLIDGEIPHKSPINTVIEKAEAADYTDNDNESGEDSADIESGLAYEHGDDSSVWDEISGELDNMGFSQNRNSPQTEPEFKAEEEPVTADNSNFTEEPVTAGSGKFAEEPVTAGGGKFAEEPVTAGGGDSTEETADYITQKNNADKTVSENISEAEKKPFDIPEYTEVKKPPVMGEYVPPSLGAPVVEETPKTGGIFSIFKKPRRTEPKVREMPDVAGSGGVRVKKPFILIGIAGAYENAGTTHHALAMTMALSRTDGVNACYTDRSKKFSDDYDSIVSELDAKEKGEWAQLGRMRIYKRSVSFDVIKKNCNVCVCDLGKISDIPRDEFYSKDVSVFVTGGRMWELDAFQNLYSEYALSRVKTVFNMVSGATEEIIRNLYSQDTSLYFAGYSPDIGEGGDDDMYMDIVKEFIERK